MSMLRRIAALAAAGLMAAAGAAAEGQQVEIVDANGQAAQMTSFTIDDETAWWARLPEGSGFDGLVLRLAGQEDSAFTPADGTALSLPDAGAVTTDAGYIVIESADESGRIRLYASHAAYAPQAEPSYRAMRAQGKWGRVTRTAALLTEPMSTAEVAGELAADTEVFVLYTCQPANREYACIRVAGETFFMAKDNVRIMTTDTDKAFKAYFLSEQEADGVRFVKTAYKANIRTTVGTPKDAILEAAPVDELLMVLTQVTADGKKFDLIYRFATGTVGFVHDSQMKELNDVEAAALLAGEETDLTLPCQGNTASATALYVFPAPDASVVGTLDEGTELTVYADIETPAGKYSLVSVGEQLGYVSSGDIWRVALTGSGDGMAEITASAASQDVLYGTRCEVTVREAVLYTEADYASAAAARVHEGELLTCSEAENGWLEAVTAEGISGWLPEEFVLRFRAGDIVEDNID